MNEADAIGFGEKVLAMLDQGSFTATYKYAVLLALVDVCLETADSDGRAPTAVHPRALAERVVELYWPHTSIYVDSGAATALVLRQNSGGQAEIVSLVGRYRDSVDPAGHAPLTRAKAIAPDGYDRLLDDVTWKLVQMPLPRLQLFGSRQERFLCDLAWDEHVSRRQFERGNVDQLLHLRPGVGDHLVRLAGLLRPLVQQQWAGRIVAINRALLPTLAEQDALDDFLFGADRVDLGPVRGDLADIQDRSCFYCDGRLTAMVDVDHFLPWARHPDNGIFNLVAAHRACNARKRDHLAAAEHVDRWAQRFRRPAVTAALDDVARHRRWGSAPNRTLSVARAVYLRLPAEARLWRAGDAFVPPDRSVLLAALTEWGSSELAAERPPPFHSR